MASSNTFFDYLPAFMVNAQRTDLSAEGVLAVLLLIAFALIGLGYYLNKKLNI